MKLIESYLDYPMKSDEKSVNKHNYIRYRIGRLKHEYWLKNRKRPNNFVIDDYDWFIYNNLKPGKTCYFGSAGYYMEPLIPDITVIEQWPVVKAFYPKAHIIDERDEIPAQFPQAFDNFVVVNNRGDLWKSVPGLCDHIQHYVAAMKPGGLLFYSIRDTQIIGYNRLKEDHYEVFYNLSNLVREKFGLHLLWHDIRFAKKQKDGAGNYDIMENPDTTNGNIKFVFQLDKIDHTINTEYFNA